MRLVVDEMPDVNKGIPTCPFYKSDDKCLVNGNYCDCTGSSDICNGLVRFDMCELIYK